MSRPVLVDASFLIDLERELTRRKVGPAQRFMRSLDRRRLIVSVITVEEVLEGAVDQLSALSSLKPYAIQGLHLAQARRCALLQRRSPKRTGENDVWLVATAQSLDADVVAADRAAFERLGSRYLRFR